MRLRPLLVLVALVLAGLTFPARAAELYGRPLRGLTPVSIVELLRNGPAYDGKTIQVRGEVLSEGGVFRLTEGKASLRVTMRDADNALPGNANGASATAEGLFRAKGPGGAPALEATGLELKR